MSMLPKISLPEIQLTIPSTKQQKKFRPFTVKEEKILLMAKEGDETDSILASSQVIRNCCLDPNFDVENLPTFDFEYLFIQLRARSIGGVIDVFFQPTKKTACQTCKKHHKVSINIDDIHIKEYPTHSNKIDLGNSIRLVMKYPTVKNISEIVKIQDKDSNNLDFSFDVIAECIAQISDSEKVYDLMDVPKEETIAFLESLTNDQFSKIAEFFVTMPVINHKVEWTCKECGEKYVHDIEGLQSFFG